MAVRYTVIAIPKDKGGKKKEYKDVYDISHIYSRGSGNDAEWIRLLQAGENGRAYDREYIDMNKYDVQIHLNEQEEGE